jgi:hypothetical protein
VRFLCVTHKKHTRQITMLGMTWIETEQKKRDASVFLYVLLEDSRRLCEISRPPSAHDNLVTLLVLPSMSSRITPSWTFINMCSTLQCFDTYSPSLITDVTSPLFNSSLLSGTLLNRPSMAILLSIGGTLSGLHVRPLFQTSKTWPGTTS